MILHGILTFAGVLLAISAFSYADSQHIDIRDIGIHFIFVIGFLSLSLPSYLMLGRRFVRLYWMAPAVFMTWYTLRGRWS
jgi:hypothetical protein